MASSGYSFKNLELWNMAQQLAIDICKLADDLPAKRSADIAARQVIRSATSIAANIAEGHGRFTIPAYLHHLNVARGSATETQGWIDLLASLRHIPQAEAEALDRRCDALIAAITRRILALEQQRAEPKRLRDEGSAYGAGNLEVPKFPSPQVPGLGPEDQP